jgi:hypothetical protein
MVDKTPTSPDTAVLFNEKVIWLACAAHETMLPVTAVAERIKRVKLEIGARLEMSPLIPGTFWNPRLVSPVMLARFEMFPVTFVKFSSSHDMPVNDANVEMSPVIGLLERSRTVRAGSAWRSVDRLNDHFWLAAWNAVI